MPPRRLIRASEAPNADERGGYETHKNLADPHPRMLRQLPTANPSSDALLLGPDDYRLKREQERNTGCDQR